jgi:Tfp pilus assembly protein PilX
MNRANEKGVAMIFTLIFVLVLTILGASLLFISQSETWAGMNYRLMTQSRYGAEAGVQAAANFIANASYTPSGAAGDPLTGYTYKGVSPVTAGGNPVVLGTAMNGLTPNYPVGTVQTNFTTATTGALTAGNNTVNYTAVAQLMSMRTVTLCGNLQPLTAQVWKITSHGDIGGVRNSEVEVSALLEQQVQPCYNYAGYATGTGCGSISFTGNGIIDSYDSANFAAGMQGYDANLGSNGNVNTANNTVIDGTFSSPDTGVGNCATGSVDALTGNINALKGCQTAAQVAAASCQGGSQAVVHLAQAMNFQAPVIPATVPTPVSAVPANQTLSACGGAGPCPGALGNYGDLSYAGNNTITLQPYINTATTPPTCSSGTYYINSISLAGNASVAIAPCPAGDTGAGQYFPIIVNIVGAGQANPLNLVGNGLSNPSMNPAMAQFQYAGSGTISLKGNGTAAGVLYAPNASLGFSGNGDWYGAVVANTISSNGNGAIHYDRRLAADLMNVSNWTLDSFNWSKF